MRCRCAIESFLLMLLMVMAAPGCHRDVRGMSAPSRGIIHAVASRNGDKIAYDVLSNRGWELCVLGLGSTRQPYRTFSQTSHCVPYEFSSDSQMLLLTTYQRYRRLLDTRIAIRVGTLDLRRRELRVVSRPDWPVYHYDPHWLPAHGGIVFTGRTDAIGVYMAPSENAPAQLLISDSRHVAGSASTTKGNYRLFTRHYRQDRCALYAYDSSTGRETVLVDYDLGARNISLAPDARLASLAIPCGPGQWRLDIRAVMGKASIRSMGEVQNYGPIEWSANSRHLALMGSAAIWIGDTWTGRTWRHPLNTYFGEYQLQGWCGRKVLLSRGFNLLTMDATTGQIVTLLDARAGPPR